jgi:hypothetical protein
LTRGSPDRGGQGAVNLLGSLNRFGPVWRTGRMLPPSRHRDQHPRSPGEGIGRAVRPNGRRPQQHPDTDCGPLPRVPPWLAGTGKHAHPEEETCCDSTPSKPNFAMASTCTPGPCTSASSSRTARPFCIGTCKPAGRRFSGTLHPVGPTLSSRLNACSPDTDSPTSALRKGSPSSWGMPSTRRPSAVARRKATRSMPPRSPPCAAAACSLKPSSVPPPCGRPGI